MRYDDPIHMKDQVKMQSYQTQLPIEVNEYDVESHTSNSSENVNPFKSQLLKWVGNKQRFSHEIISYFPKSIKYIEPFLGSAAVLGTLKPKNGVGSDCFSPLMEIWKTLQSNPLLLMKWYKDRYDLIEGDNRPKVYEDILSSYNKNPNGADFLFLSRTCYGGVIRFRKDDGYMSTPCGAHKPMPPNNFSLRVKEWHSRTRKIEFLCQDYKKSFDMARSGDLIYCDPPYSHSQAILYGAQSFSLQELFDRISYAKKNGIYVALSIDGSKNTANTLLELNIPDNLFEREAYVNCGRSMLKRFQMIGESLEDHIVTDRLLLTY